MPGGWARGWAACGWFVLAMALDMSTAEIKQNWARGLDFAAADVAVQVEGGGDDVGADDGRDDERA